MIDKIDENLSLVNTFDAKSKEEVEAFRIKYLGKKGILNNFFTAFKEVPPKEKKDYGQALNTLKNAVMEKVKTLQAQTNNPATQGYQGDLSRPGFPLELGSRHPLSLVKNRIVEIFSQIGFYISEGPEIEDDWHNFTALNLPEFHPARDMQDTFFIQTDPDILLRTHTSSVQVRYMEKNQPPIRTISPGRVFRNEAISARAHCIFHQVEGLYIDKNVSFSDLKQTLLYFTKALFGKSKIRLRPSYFPFTEPSAEVDIWDDERNQWMEVLGCGMVDPAVLENVGYDSKKWHGYAFGIGVERMAMLKYKINDIRLFYNGDVRFLRQFS